MKLIVEFYKDFDPSVLNGMGYAYAFRTLHMQGSKEHLLEAIRIIDSVTSERSIMLKGDKDEQKEMEKEEKDLAIWLRLSICSISSWVDRSKAASNRSVPLVRCNCCKVSFIGVSGLLISCATCLAIVRHAISRSLRAKRSVESANASIIWL